MPLNGQYEPSAMSFSRDQVDVYERSAEKKATRLIPVFVLTPEED